MPRIFTALCLAAFATVATACDDEEPKDPATAADASSSDATGEASSTGEPADATTTGEDTTAGSETGEQPGTATIAPPKLDHLEPGA